MTDVRLNEYDKEEFWDICRIVNPSITREWYDKFWDEFQDAKEKHYAEEARRRMS